MQSRFVELTEELFVVALKHMDGVKADNKSSRIVFQNYFDSKDDCHLLLVSAQWDSADEGTSSQRV